MKVVEASEIEVVAGQHGRDATIQRLEMEPDGTRYRLKCRQASAPVDGYIAMDTQIATTERSYLGAYNAAEAWAWPAGAGERP